MYKIKRNDKAAALLGIFSAILLFISGSTGVNTWLNTRDLILNYVSSVFIELIFIFILIIASLGSISVFLGSILILKKHPLVGKLLISIGSGAGLLGFLSNLYISFISNNINVYSYLSISSLGIILALIAQLFIEKGIKHNQRQNFDNALTY